MVEAQPNRPKEPIAGGLILDTINCIDALAGLKKLPDESVDCVMTSPPYWAMRDYGLTPQVWGGDENCNHEFEVIRTGRPNASGGAGSLKDTNRESRHAETSYCAKCGAWRGSLGLESDYERYLDHLILIFDEVRRVLKATGTLWVNFGDTYAGSWGSYSQSKQTKMQQRNGTSSSWPRRAYSDATFRPPSSFPQLVPRRSLCQIPARFAIRMAEEGWILRNDIIWHKPNHMPASVKNRLTCSWEHLFFFVKSEKYFFDLDAVRVPHTSVSRPRKTPPRLRPSPNLSGLRLPPNPGEPRSFHPNGKNPGDFWNIAAETRTLGAILGNSGAVKVPGGAGWVGHPQGGQARILREQDPRWLSPKGKNPGDVWEINTMPFKGAHFAVYPEALCERPIKAGCPPGGLVVDPFIGAGTTAIVTRRLGRRFIGFELNPEYVAIAKQRLSNSK